MSGSTSKPSILALNNDLLSPLTLAAAHIRRSDSPDLLTAKVQMFQFLLVMHNTDLLGLDVEYDLRDYCITERARRLTNYTAIDWICSKRIEQAIIIPNVRKVIETTAGSLHSSLTWLSMPWSRCALLSHPYSSPLSPAHPLLFYSCYI